MSSTTITICIIIFILSMIGYACGKFSLGIVGMTTIGALVLSGCLEPDAALAYFANKNVMIMLSMFVVSAGLSKTSLIGKISNGIGGLTGGSFKLTFLAYLILAVILTNFLNSPLVVFTILFPLVDQMCKDYNVSPSKVMFPVALCCIACCCILPFGAAIQQSGLYNGFLESYGMSANFTPMDFTKGRWLFLFIVPAWSYFFGYKFAPEPPPMEIAMVDFKKNETAALKPFADIAGVAIFFGVVVLFILSNKLHVQPWVVCFVGACLTVLLGVLTTNEAIKALPINLACMLVGALAMAGALTATGAGDLVGQTLSSAIGGVKNSYVLGAVFFIIPFILTQFMQNQAVMSIFTPICILVCKSIGANPTGLLIMITAGSLTAFMTPMATSCIPAIMGCGGYDIKSLIKQGWLASIIFTVIYVATTMTFIPCF